MIIFASFNYQEITNLMVNLNSRLSRAKLHQTLQCRFRKTDSIFANIFAMQPTAAQSEINFKIAFSSILVDRWFAQIVATGQMKKMQAQSAIALSSILRRLNTFINSKMLTEMFKPQSSTAQLSFKLALSSLLAQLSDLTAFLALISLIYLPNLPHTSLERILPTSCYKTGFLYCLMSKVLCLKSNL